MMHNKGKNRGMAARLVALAMVGMLSVCGLAGCGSEPVQEPVDHEAIQQEIHDQIVQDADSDLDLELDSEPMYYEEYSSDKYAYRTLTAEEQVVYDQIVYAIKTREERVTLATTDQDCIEHVYDAIRFDYCDLFWVDQLNWEYFTQDDVITSIDLTLEFTMTETEQEAYQEIIDQEVEDILADAPWDLSDFEKAHYVYMTLIDRLDYVRDSEHNQDIISAFVNHETVCQGYAYATQYLLERLGIPCYTVSGTANDENHAWNLAKLDGEYYYIDTTWGDAQYRAQFNDDVEEVMLDYYNYDYFGATSKSLFITHTPSGEFELPDCTSMIDNFYYHKGRYVDYWNPDQIARIFLEDYQTGTDHSEIMFSDAELMNQAVDYYIEEGQLWNYCDAVQSIMYMTNPDTNILKVFYE